MAPGRGPAHPGRSTLARGSRRADAPRSTLQCAIPTVRIDSLLDCLSDGSGEHASDVWIRQELPVRFRTWQVEETLRSLNQPRNGFGEFGRGLAKILPGKASEFVVI